MSKELDKIKLIYEFNNNSPLFARVADAELNEGNVDKALQILEKGLIDYPDYISAHLVYVEALAKKGFYKDAVNKLERLRNKVNDKETIDYYLDKTETERAKNYKLESSIRQLEKPIEESLDHLADTINKAKIPPVDDKQPTKKVDTYTQKGKQFISETLAEIYLSQSNYKESLEIYEKLLESNPGKAEHFQTKIDEIKYFIKN